MATGVIENPNAAITALNNKFPNGTLPDLNNLGTERIIGLVNTSTLNKPVNAAGIVLHYASSANYATQLLEHVGANGLWLRNKVSGTWNDWERLDGKISKSGDTYTGSLNYKTTQYTSGTAPSSNVFAPFFMLTDSTNTNIVIFQGTSYTNGDEGFEIVARRNQSGTWKYNALRLLLDSSFNQKVYVTNPKAWRTGLGLSKQAVTPIYRSGTSNVAGVIYKYGDIVQFSKCIKITADIAKDETLISTSENLDWSYGMVMQGSVITPIHSNGTAIILDKALSLSNGAYPIIVLTAFLQ